MPEYSFYIASENFGKVVEIEKFLKDENIDKGISIFTLKDVEEGIREKYSPIENGSSFLENARIKARALYELMEKPVLADDSGLEVDILNGEPGVYSSRYEKTDELRIQKLISKTSKYDISQRTARFISCLCFKDNRENEIFFSGTVEGLIADAPSGANGFGYDPVFYYPPLKKTFGDLLPEEKLAISHRSNALRLFIHFLKQNFNG